MNTSPQGFRKRLKLFSLQQELLFPLGCLAVVAQLAEKDGVLLP